MAQAPGLGIMCCIVLWCAMLTSHQWPPTWWGRGLIGGGQLIKFGQWFGATLCLSYLWWCVYVQLHSMCCVLPITMIDCWKKRSTDLWIGRVAQFCSTSVGLSLRLVGSSHVGCLVPVVEESCANWLGWPTCSIWKPVHWVVVGLAAVGPLGSTSKTNRSILLSVQCML